MNQLSDSCTELMKRDGSGAGQEYYLLLEPLHHKKEQGDKQGNRPAPNGITVA